MASKRKLQGYEITKPKDPKEFEPMLEVVGARIGDSSPKSFEVRPITCDLGKLDHPKVCMALDQILQCYTQMFFGCLKQS